MPVAGKFSSVLHFPNDKPAFLPLAITPPSMAAAHALRQALGRYEGRGIPDGLIVTVTDPVAEGANAFHLMCGEDNWTLAAPLRLGGLLEKIRVFLSGPPSHTLTCGPYTLDLVGRIWQGPGKEGAAAVTAELTDREAALLEALINAPGHKLERTDLLEHVWGYHKDAETHTLETHIYRLRRKIEQDAANPRLLLTEGSAYRLSV
ncbi:MAG: winged helix-turn-helix domain-containing protein [Alphaproteobacteria bacterium]|nr:winged helix-turn-helix domain-containing protein [Alphaproteobacteria bacterium]